MSETWRYAVHVYWFESSSGDKLHETIRYSDGTTSCSCPGWCKRISGGVRTCKHVRAVVAGCGEQMAKTHGPVGGNLPPVPAPEAEGVKLPKPQRRFNFETD